MRDVKIYTYLYYISAYIHLLNVCKCIHTHLQICIHKHICMHRAHTYIPKYLPYTLAYKHTYTCIYLYKYTQP